MCTSAWFFRPCFVVESCASLPRLVWQQVTGQSCGAKVSEDEASRDEGR